MTEVNTSLTSEPFELWHKKALFLAKRGNLESELLLVAYIDSLDSSISAENIELFEALLSENDQNLFCWLMEFNPKMPHDSVTSPAKYHSLIKNIRTNYLK